MTNESRPAAWRLLARRPAAALLLALGAGCALLLVLLVTPHRYFSGATGAVCCALLTVVGLSVAASLLRGIAQAVFDGTVRWRPGPLFAGAGSLFALLAVSAPVSMIVAMGTYAPLRIQEPRAAILVGVALVTGISGLVAAVHGLAVWLHPAAASSSGQLAYQAVRDLTVQVWALLVLFGCVFILY